ncbi:flagellin N-terminal helical domain-containing protein [Desulforamulus aquiferis]|uniref:Flagellin n=1 Tax=Desulforamulus aquiferis TaxID=1397668 RepID=A0AAW7ZEY4_9FIRM|nr:flagellin [Desulforamulus aquiferis]MDO7788344.1 flagellin [Desulforamulus aquiferis]
MIINHNMMAMNAHRSLTINTGATSKSIEKLSSGLRINRAGDDAAGLSISEKMRGQIRGLQQASRNAQDGISLLQTAEGSMNETHAILQRMRELAVQSANDTNVTIDRDALQEEFNALKNEIDRIANTTEFNTQKLISSDAGTLVFHVGANQDQIISVTFADMRATETTVNLGYIDSAVTIDMSVAISNRSNANAMITSIDNSITAVSTQRSKLGAIQNRLEHTIKNLDVAAENLQASESRIRDVDMAKEMMEFTKTNILNQAAQAMLAQANQLPQGVLQLLR